MTNSPGAVGGHALALTLVGAAISLLACSSEESTKAGFVSIGDAALKTYASVICERFDRCTPNLVKSAFGEGGDCATRILPAVEAEFTGLGTTVSQRQLNACTEKLASVPCEIEGRELTAEAYSFIPECQFKGTLENGAVCSSSAQCKTGSCYKGLGLDDQISLCGSCSERAAEGGDCTSANCDGGLVCVKAKCITPSDVGGPCDADLPCAGILQCNAGTCQKPLGKDADCNPQADVCDPSLGLDCLPTTQGAPTKGRCGAVSFVRLGEKCGFDRTAVKLTLCLGSSCDKDDDGTCLSDLKEGDTCSTDTAVASAECEFPLGCVRGKCTRTDLAACQ